MNSNDPNFPTQENLPPRVRRRKRGQLILPKDAEGRSALLQSLAKRAYPSYELFVFAALCGAVLGLGYLIDSQALLLFGVLLAPLMTPWIGLLLAAITGSRRFFFETLMALLISAALVLLTGVLAGFAARPFLPRTLNEAFTHSRLWWPDLIIIALTAIILTISFVRSEEKPFLPSVMLAYGLFVPLAAGGFGLGSGVGNIWPNGLLVFVVNFAWASMFGLLTLIFLRFLPTNFSGFALSAGMTLIFVVILIWQMSGSNWNPVNVPQAPAPTAVSLQIASPASTLSLPPASQLTPTSGPSSTPMIESATPTETTDATQSLEVTPVPLTLEATMPPTDSPTVTLTIQPTPVYARIISKQGGGAFLRESPNGKYIATLDNYTYVEVLPDTQQISGWTWAHVIAVKSGVKLEGWILQLVIEVATPAPSWSPTVTPNVTDTPTITPKP
jgi:hypothetical protein